jgi:hypothetical protein
MATQCWHTLGLAALAAFAAAAAAAPAAVAAGDTTDASCDAAVAATAAETTAATPASASLSALVALPSCFSLMAPSVTGCNARMRSDTETDLERERVCVADGAPVASPLTSLLNCTPRLSAASGSSWKKAPNLSAASSLDASSATKPMLASLSRGDASGDESTTANTSVNLGAASSADGGKMRDAGALLRRFLRREPPALASSCSSSSAAPASPPALLTSVDFLRFSRFSCFSFSIAISLVHTSSSLALAGDALIGAAAASSSLLCWPSSLEPSASFGVVVRALRGSVRTLRPRAVADAAADGRLCVDVVLRGESSGGSSVGGGGWLPGGGGCCCAAAAAATAATAAAATPAPLSSDVFLRRRSDKFFDLDDERPLAVFFLFDLLLRLLAFSSSDEPPSSSDSASPSLSIVIDVTTMALARSFFSCSRRFSSCSSDTSNIEWLSSSWVSPPLPPLPPLRAVAGFDAGVRWPVTGADASCAPVAADSGSLVTCASGGGSGSLSSDDSSSGSTLLNSTTPRGDATGDERRDDVHAAGSAAEPSPSLRCAKLICSKIWLAAITAPGDVPLFTGAGVDDDVAVDDAPLKNFSLSADVLVEPSGRNRTGSLVVVVVVAGVVVAGVVVAAGVVVVVVVASGDLRNASTGFLAPLPDMAAAVAAAMRACTIGEAAPPLDVRTTLPDAGGGAEVGTGGAVAGVVVAVDSTKPVALRWRTPGEPTAGGVGEAVREPMKLPPRGAAADPLFRESGAAGEPGATAATAAAGGGALPPFSRAKAMAAALSEPGDQDWRATSSLTVGRRRADPEEEAPEAAAGEAEALENSALAAAEAVGGVGVVVGVGKASNVK